MALNIKTITCYSRCTGAELDAQLQIEVGMKFSLKIKFDEAEFVEDGSDLCDALRKLRINSLEQLEIYPLINGCRRNFLSSGMQRQSTGGQVGYILLMGKANRREDAVATFAAASREEVASVIEQDAYVKMWMETRKNERI